MIINSKTHEHLKFIIGQLDELRQTLKDVEKCEKLKEASYVLYEFARLPFGRYFLIPDSAVDIDFSDTDKIKLRPIAETIAMLDGNAFFDIDDTLYLQYLKLAHTLYEDNGGDAGWAGLASFAKPFTKGIQKEE